MGVIFTFFSTNLLLAQVLVEQTSPPHCNDNQCEGEIWYHKTAQFNKPDFTSMGLDLGDSCYIIVDYKVSTSCNLCKFSIVSYKVHGCNNNFETNKSLLLNACLLQIMLMENACNPTEGTPCIENVKVSSGSCMKAYYYYDTPGHDPFGSSAAYVPVISPWGFLGPNTPTFIPILPGETVYVPCSPICCKTKYKICVTFNQSGSQISWSMISQSDTTLIPPCDSVSPVDPYETLHPCLPSCWFNTWNFSKASNYYLKPEHK